MKTPSRMLAAIFLLYITMLPVTLFAVAGEVDLSFDPEAGPNGAIYAAALQPDGKILVGGVFTSYNNFPRGRIARLLADGSLDASFQTTNGASFDVECLALQPDGRIVIGGDFHSVNGTIRVRIARLNSDGTLDSSFDPGLGANSIVDSVALQQDGKLLICGAFETFNGTNKSYIARLNVDGSLDTSFDPHPNNYVYSVAVQPDGKVLCGGLFTAVNNVSHYHLARLNSDGSLDTNFNVTVDAPFGVTYVSSIALQPNGKIFIAGHFAKVNNAPRSNVARLNSNGGTDSFNANPDATVHCLAIQTDGRPLIGGFFSAVDNVARWPVARLNLDGSLDKSYDPNPGGNGPASTSLGAILVQPDGRVLIAGDFQTLGNIARRRIARLQSDGLRINLSANATILTWPTNLTGFTLQTSDDVASPAAWSDLVGQPSVSGADFVITNIPPGTMRFYRLQK